MVIFLVLKWNSNIDKYIVNPKTVEPTSDADGAEDQQPVTRESPDSMKGGQLEFDEVKNDD